jgi:hypothetical protein
MGVLDQVATPDDIPDSDEADTPTYPGLSQPTTTAEAQRYARRFLDRSLSGESEANEQSLMHDIENNAATAKKALQEAQAKLMAARVDPQEQALRQASAWLAPTKTGRFGEQLGLYTTERANEMEQQRKLEAAQNTGNLDYNLKMSDLDANTLQSRLALQKLHEQQEGSLAGKSLTVLGRSIAGNNAATKPNSPFGKIAEDEGLTPGTPPFVARVNELAQADLANKRARAGTDASFQDPIEKNKVATDAGVPADVPDPWNGQSTRERMTGQAIEQRAATKKLNDYTTADASTQAGLRAIDDFQKLNAQTHTGPELGPVSLGGVHAGLHGVGADAGHGEGWNVNPISWFAGFKPNIQTMNKLSSQLTGLAIPDKGFGRVTNMDMGIFQKGMIGTDKSPQTNNAIAQALRIRLQNDLDRHEFENNFYQVHGHLRGAEQAWNKYLTDNPIFATKDGKTPIVDPKTQTPVLNPNRLDYKTYFANHNKALLEQGDLSDEAPPGSVDPVQGDRTRPDQVAADNVPAKAAGGSIHMDDGGDVNAALAALRSGATAKLSPGREDANSPGLSFAGEAAGGAGAVAALLALSRLRGRLGGGPNLARFVASHPNLASSLAGAGAGAVAGGAASKDADPTTDALTYGVTGAMLGPLGRLGTRGATAALGRLADRVSGNTINPGERHVINAVSKDTQGDWDTAASQLRADARAKIPSTLGDSVGPRTTGLATAALTKDTPETAAYGAQIADRQANANTRVMDQTNQALKPDNYLTETKKLQDALYSNAKPLYAQAYQQFPSVQSPTLMNLMNTPSGQEAAARAFRMMQDMQLPVGQPDAMGMVQHPSLQYLDQVKRSLDDMISSEEGSGPTYQATNQGRVLRGMRDKLRNEVDTATQVNGQPGPYQQARQQYAGDLEVADALRSGREDFSKMTPDELTAKVGQMSFAEKDAFRSGIAEGLFQKLGTTSDTQNPAKKIISTPALQQKLTALFDKPSEAGKYLEALQREADIYDTSKGLTNSVDKGQAASLSPSSISTAVRSKLMTNDTAGQVADTLSATAGPEAQEKIARLRAAADRLKSRADFGNQAGTAVGAGLATAVTPSNTDAAAVQ